MRNKYVDWLLNNQTVSQIFHSGSHDFVTAHVESTNHFLASFSKGPKYKEKLNDCGGVVKPTPHKGMKF